MGIKIKNISIKNLGPISELTQDLGNINLIFGHNEKGKSYLVEFLIYSLFQTSGWRNLRSKLGSGRVKVEGLADGIIDFYPSSLKKIEDFLSYKYIGLPPDFSKLLVFRSAEVELSEENESNRIMLRRYLSHKEILEKIKNSLPKTIAECIIDGYTINGDRRNSKLKEREDFKQKLHRISQLFTEVQNTLLSGEMNRLKYEEDELKVKYNALEKAKRYNAYEISMKIDKLEVEAKQIDETKIGKLLVEVNQLRLDKEKYQRDERRLKPIKESTKHYEWLDKGVEEYERYNLEETKTELKKIFPILLIVLAVTIGTLIVFEAKWVALVLFIILVVIGIIYKREYERFVTQRGKREEIFNLKKDYQERFGEELINLAVISARKDSIQKEYNIKGLLEEQMSRDSENLIKTESELSKEINELFGEKIDIDDWVKRLENEKARKRDLEGKANEEKLALIKMQVAEKEYVMNKQAIEFDYDEYEKVGTTLKQVQDDIVEKGKDLNKLKQSICEYTRDEFSVDWMKLIENLADKRLEELNKYKDLTAEIIANRYISDVILKLYEEEDQKITEALDSVAIKRILQKVTTHYTSISLQGDKLIVSDPYSDFPVSEISDGAKEQVFLSLRIGLAMHWFEKDGLFLILDDAFLHSDDKRCPELIDKVLELGNNGWQILYFTFERSIKELFDERAGNYTFVNLDEL